MFLSSLVILGAVQAVLGKTQLYVCGVDPYLAPQLTFVQGMNIAGFEFGCLITVCFHANIIAE